MENKTRVHVFVSGRVQGVFFRENTRRKAEELGIFGWVKNLANGQVEAVFEGEKTDVEKIVNWSKKGPNSAQVTDFKIEWQEFKGEFDSFKIRY